MEMFQDFPKPEFNNTAGRLLLVLDGFRNQNKGGWPTHVVWRRVLFKDEAEIQSSEPLTEDKWEKLLDVLIMLFRALTDVEKAIKIARPTDSHIYLEDFPKLKRLFSPENLAASFDTQRSLISDIAFVNLRHCAKDLPQEGEVGIDTLKEIFDVATDLFEQVRTSDMPRSLKTWLMKLLEKVLQAITYYWINGGKGLRDALVTLVGELAVDGGELKDTHVQAGVKEKFFAIVAKLTAVSKQVAEIKPLYELAKGALQLVLSYRAGELPPPSDQ